MSITALVAASALLGLFDPTASEAAPLNAPVLAQAAPFLSSQGVVSPRGGDYKVMPNGCTYVRTQAPGYPERWILVVNPHQIGLPKPPKGCRGMM